MRFSLVPLILLVIPLAEIAAFVVVGGQIGVWATLGMVLLTAIIGSFLLRRQGIGLFNRINGELRSNRVPGRELVHGVMILVAGVLLLTPGFVTDSFGFLLFVPAVRDLVWRSVKDRVVVQAMSGGFGAGTAGFGHPSSRGAADDGVVDLDTDEYERNPNPSSPWSDDRDRLNRPGQGGSTGGDGL
ncbi:membrane protein FxsA [Hoeflea sp. YIM 152468]|uniref:FxsA family protein n=1 Tax=Hoeflea sp. YIM 152468 TaxID=3031759 RepID=UPI0023D9C791|nr:FxsA family protein [Hoeflea sp. YIM 152468]MDF1610494.1 membrane protein FxsA [Hoeflea sp. YIM 152468]